MGVLVYGRNTVNNETMKFSTLFFSEWVKSLSQNAISEFQRASGLGNELQETWLVYNSAVYLLNYTTHLAAQKRHRELIPILTCVLKNLRSVGHVG
jgi:ABC-type bacteriocin/lantibiotic exporter with double-glycine peptidase domain